MVCYLSHITSWLDWKSWWRWSCNLPRSKTRHAPTELCLGTRIGSSWRTDEPNSWRQIPGPDFESKNIGRLLIYELKIPKKAVDYLQDHGFVTRGNTSIPEVKADVDDALQRALDFANEHKYDYTYPSSASTLAESIISFIVCVVHAFITL